MPVPDDILPIPPVLPADKTRLRWDDCPIYRMVGGPYGGLLREIEPGSNALAFMPPGGKVHVYVVKDDVLQYVDEVGKKPKGES